MLEKKRPSLPADTKTLPARFYTSEEVFEKELERVFFDMWLYAGREEEIAHAGDYVLREIGGESLVLLRRDDGTPGAFYNVCRHRGTRLCEEPGSFKGSIQCPYHAWTYALDGSLLNAPHMDQVEGFRVEPYSLNEIPVRLWDGHLFVNLASEPTAFDEHILEMDETLANWRMGELKRVHRTVYELEANWKLILQNYSECIHCPIIHPLLNKHTPYLGGENYPVRETFLGSHMELVEGAETLTTDGKSSAGILDSLDEDQRRRVLYYVVLPNMLLNLHPDYMVTFALWPRAVDRTQIVCEWHFHPDAIARSDFDPATAIEFWEITNAQDWRVSDLAQKGIASRAYRPGPYSNREESLVAIDRWITRRLGSPGA